MKKTSAVINSVITAIILAVCYGLCLTVHQTFRTDTLIPSIFILGSFLISILTDGYVYGIVSALISVVAVNFAFTFPFFKINFSIQENSVSALIMIVISVMTCALATKLKRQEALKAEKEAAQMKANLLRAVSHDFRTPLTTIYGASSTLLENKASLSEEQQQQLLSGICSDAQWLSCMVENMLSITKLDSGNVKLIKSPTVLDELIDSVLIKFGKRYPSTEVNVNIPDDFITIPMDAILIEQVLINILENAVQHAEGMTELSLNVFAISGKAVFEVRDNGSGIPPERIKNLFEGGWTGSSSPSDGKKTNSGIGLSVCAAIVKAHGGEIRAENIKTGGTLIRFTLDMEEQD